MCCCWRCRAGSCARARCRARNTSPEITKKFPQKPPESPSKTPSAQDSPGMRRLFPRLFSRILLLIGPRPFSRPVQFSIFATVTLLFLFSPTPFGPSSGVYGTLNTIMELQMALGRNVPATFPGKSVFLLLFFQSRETQILPKMHEITTPNCFQLHYLFSRLKRHD